MTRVAIATYVCEKLNKPELIPVAEDFTARNYVKVFNSYNWRDVEYRYNDTITAGNNATNLNSGIQRVASVLLQPDKLLDPVNAVLISQTHPEYLASSGEPVLYEEIYDPAGVAYQIKLYPAPVVDAQLTIVGIRQVDEMTDSASTSSIRGIDNALIAYVESDVLQRLKLYGMATSKRQEADELLQAAKDQDKKERSNIPRSIKQLSVYGNTMAEMMDSVSAKTGLWSPEDRVLMRESLRRNYVKVYDSTLWREACDLINATSTDPRFIILPKEVDEVLACRRVDQAFGMVPSDLSYWFDNPSILDSVGEPVNYSLLPPVGLASQPANGAEQISIVSDSDADAGQVVIRGMHSGSEMVEVIALTGTTPVITAGYYDTVLTFSKKKTVGTVTATGASSILLLDTFSPIETDRKYIRLKFIPMFTDNVSLLLAIKRKITPFVQDEDTPVLRKLGNCLIEMTAADMFRKAGDKDNAAASAAMAAAELKLQASIEKEQAANVSMVTPYTEDSGKDF